MNRSILAARVKGGRFIRYHVKRGAALIFELVSFAVLLYLKVLLVVK